MTVKLALIRAVVALGVLFGASEAFAQCGTTIPGGTICGNRTGAQGLNGPLTNPLLGVPGTSTGQIGFAGSGSGTATIAAQSAAGSPTLLLPNTSGTLPSTAASPILLNATTGQLSCPTCALTSGAALTAGDDTNVTLTLGGSPSSALVNAASITAGWTGTLAPIRGGTGIAAYTLGDMLYSNGANTLATVSGNTTTGKQYLSQTGTGSVSAAPAWATITGADITGAALTAANDTNVTLTLGGTPATSLLRASSITAGWTGTLALSRGGLGGSQAAATANQIPVYPGSGGGAVPTTVGGAGGFFDTICSSTIGQAWVRATGGWGCTALGWANPVWWGADPTGSSDSQPALNSAIASLSSTGGTVRFPAGNFKLNNTSPQSISTSGTIIKGSGRYATILHPQSTTQNLFNVTAPNGVEFVDLAIQGSTSAISTGGVAISFSGTQGCRAENLWITEVFEGISLNNSTACKVQFVKMYDIYGAFGIGTSSGGGDNIEFNQIDPLFYSTTTYGFTSGFGAWTTSHSYAAGAVVSNASGWFVAQTGGTSAATGSGPQITMFGTLITDGTVQWFFLGATSAAGIKIFATSNSNYVAFNDISGPWSEGIQINSSDNNIIVGNTIGQTLGIGIQLLANATNSYIAANFFSGMYTPTGNGIEDNNGSANGTHIVNNRINGAGWHCIIVQGSPDWVISNNQITGCGNITGADAIDIGSPTLTAAIHDNVIIPSSGQANAIAVTSGASDFLSIHDNNVQTGSISYAGTGTHSVIRSNIGYNPVGLTAGTSTGTTGSTITAGPSPETHYITQSASFNAAVKSGSTTLCTVPSATVPCVIDLGPNESYTVTWTTTQPTFSRFVH